MKIPILKLEGVLLTSVPEELIDRDALDFQSDLLEKVRATEADGVLIDITALEVVDSFMARVINETANMVRMLGAEVVLCGMNPSVALTLVEMGRELIDVRTALNLDKGMALMRRMLASRHQSAPPERR